MNNTNGLGFVITMGVNKTTTPTKSKKKENREKENRLRLISNLAWFDARLLQPIIQRMESKITGSIPTLICTLLFNSNVSMVDLIGNWLTKPATFLCFPPSKNIHVAKASRPPSCDRHPPPSLLASHWIILPNWLNHIMLIFLISINNSFLSTNWIDADIGRCVGRIHRGAATEFFNLDALNFWSQHSFSTWSYHRIDHCSISAAGSTIEATGIACNSSGKLLITVEPFKSLVWYLLFQQVKLSWM